MCDLERLACRSCAPTLMGQKAGCMFAVSPSSFRRMQPDLSALAIQLMENGIRLRVFRRKENYLIYLYRENLLAQSLSHPTARAILARKGYGANVFAGLQSRLLSTEDFPHEIGLFLGYPPEDVRGFMEQGGAACKAQGCWKVYGDVEQASSLFITYRRCKERVLEAMQSGQTLRDIIKYA